MSSSTLFPPFPADIGLYWTDEDIIMSLEKIAKGSSLPENVTTDVNPYQHLPSNLPDGIWYLLHSEHRKDSKHGFWKARGEACEIYRNSSIIGWRTTLEYYEGRAPHGRRTNWVMQEYMITHKGLCCNSNPKESSLLCRVFLCSGARPNQEMQHKLGGSKISGDNHICPNSVVPDSGSTHSISGSQAAIRDNNIVPLAATGGLPNVPVGNMQPLGIMHDIDCISRGDYLELDDLADPESRSSSSDNTSCLTLTSDECFDSLALLRDLEDEIRRNEQAKDANVKLSVAAPVRPNEVVMRPANLGSLISSNWKSPAKAIEKEFIDKRVLPNATTCQKVDKGKEETSNSHNVAASSSSHKPVREGEKKVVAGRIKKLNKKYLCFMPF